MLTQFDPERLVINWFLAQKLLHHSTHVCQSIVSGNYPAGAGAFALYRISIVTIQARGKTALRSHNRF